MKTQPRWWQAGWESAKMSVTKLRGRNQARVHQQEAIPRRLAVSLGDLEQCQTC